MNYTSEEIELYRRLGELVEWEPELDEGWKIIQLTDGGAAINIRSYSRSKLQHSLNPVLIPPLGALVRAGFSPYKLSLHYEWIFDVEEERDIIRWEARMVKIDYEYSKKCNTEKTTRMSFYAPTPEGAVVKALIAILESKDE